ncbi:hypothetical protein K466DRAFT_163651 [Polyporus arcularius HHB13444]|uniref:Uncharacterized protein n=1 Tax=Polyporus arcularius HHB13444 TaxID=1314778 RepID=A0A5C3P9X5_9APHY|nr:hypothetical protein K466DRAFT_163651 [Polyporus arcularius HHB13444]
MEFSIQSAQSINGEGDSPCLLHSDNQFMIPPRDGTGWPCNCAFESTWRTRYIISSALRLDVQNRSLRAEFLPAPYPCGTRKKHFAASGGSADKSSVSDDLLSSCSTGVSAHLQPAITGAPLPSWILLHTHLCLIGSGGGHTMAILNRTMICNIHSMQHRETYTSP